MGTLSGNKFSNAHSTAIDAAIVVVRAVEQLDCVSKISLGYIQPIRGGGPGKRRLKIDAESELACVKVMARGGTSIQELRIYTSNKAEVIAVLENLNA